MGILFRILKEGRRRERKRGEGEEERQEQKESGKNREGGCARDNIKKRVLLVEIEKKKKNCQKWFVSCFFPSPSFALPLPFSQRRGSFFFFFFDLFFDFFFFFFWFQEDA